MLIKKKRQLYTVGLLVGAVILLAAGYAAVHFYTDAQPPDVFYGKPAHYEREVGAGRQIVELGVSPVYGNKPLRPLYGLELRNPKSQKQLLDAVLLNHYFRWQEADWSARKETTFDQFRAKLLDGQDLSYPALDTSNGENALQIKMVNPARPLRIVLIPTHEGVVTAPAGPTTAGLSIKNTILADGSLVVRVPLLYVQIQIYEKGNVEVSNVATTSLIIALMELGIPRDAIPPNAQNSLATWWENQPEPGTHKAQYDFLQRAFKDVASSRSILQVLEAPHD